MDLKEFAQEFLEAAQLSIEDTNRDLEEQLTEDMLEYVIDGGQVEAPQICMFKKTGARISAYDYNEETGSLDLFLFHHTKTLLGKVNNGDVEDLFNRMFRFYKEVIDGKLLKSDQTPTDELAEVIELFLSTKGKVDTLRMFVLTDGMTDYETESFEGEDVDIIMEQHVWDMQRVYNQHRIMSGKDKIEIDFPTSYDTELQCLKMNSVIPDMEAYLAIIPGITLAKIYKKYQQQLLEKNVRTFLQFKSKVNKGIRDTLLECPEMFFSYNNGISTTASNIEVREDENGSLYITKLYDWQIVNGGQTTASIAATYNTKGVDLTKVFVPMKISVISNPERINEIVPQISQFANKQTAVKDSDFKSNDPYPLDIENKSRSIWVTNGDGKPVYKWYFERTRGQYLDQKAQLAGLNLKNFDIEYPKKFKLVKTDVSRYEMCWMQRPDCACKGAEQNYGQFVKEIKANPINVTDTYYKRLVAKAILFRYIDKLVKEHDFGGYKMNMNCYVLASLSLLSKKMLDFDYIWKYQGVQPELTEIIENLISLVWDHITDTTKIGNAQSANIGEKTKRLECWNQLKIILANMEPLPENLLLSPSAQDDEDYNPAQQSKIDEAWSYSASDWVAMEKYAKEHHLLTPIQRRTASNFGKMKSNNRMFSIKQAMAGLKIVEELKEKGFTI